MISPKESYIKDKKNAGELRKVYNEQYRKLYVDGSLTKTGIDDVNEESLIAQSGKFIQGKIYTFDYDPLYKDSLSYYDKRPIILVNDVFKAKGTKNNIVTGVNLNFLPELAKVALLQSFYEGFKDDIEKSQRMAAYGKINLSISNMIGFFKEWEMVLEFFNGGHGLGYQYAYRNYIVQRITKVRYIEYNHWQMLPFINPTLITGDTVENIYKEYWKDKINLNKK